MHEPNFFNIDKFILTLKKFKIKYLFACINLKFENYIISKVPDIKIYEVIYDDGTFPKNDIIVKWITKLNELVNEKKILNIGIICTHGLGRSPLLAAIALIEIFNFTPIESLHFIRKKIRGCFNKSQMYHLIKYKKINKNFLDTIFDKLNFIIPF